jgi:hypothetical protein
MENPHFPASKPRLRNPPFPRVESRMKNYPFRGARTVDFFLIFISDDHTT